jgi:hypothetical protein
VGKPRGEQAASQVRLGSPHFHMGDLGKALSYSEPRPTPVNFLPVSLPGNRWESLWSALE